jgi:hypothetical protein
LEERSRTNTFTGSWGYEVAATEDARRTGEENKRTATK